MVDLVGITNKLKQIDTSDLPDFYDFKKPLERSLWVLWLLKSKLDIKQLSADEISVIIRDVKETSVDAKSIIGAFNRAKDKVHVYHENGIVRFEIMKAGKDYLLSQSRGGTVEVLYFEPDKRYSSKRLLAKGVLSNLKGELKIVDPYFGARTLDMLKEIDGNTVKFLTKIDNVSPKITDSLLREVKDFKHEKTSFEFRSYPNNDLHDRYIISSDLLVLLGHSIKDLGNKESFAILLTQELNKNVVEALRENFDRRWKQSNTF